ncbi:MAG: NAD(P)H-dependent oxidoreductase [Marinifilaceae bacterium]|jgi:glutathione-regulated potassium-efflux system ancillary protein KefG|nr:NAD(P)H-dependent oxidoreductase [Marinifilaceae bacterium]
MNVLILFAHPDFNKSKVNKQLTSRISDIRNLKFHDLYDEYPDGFIDKKREQKLMEKHDVIIFHFPMYWYSTPPILKEYQDMVLEHGWAFGSNTSSLYNKLFLSVITTGGRLEQYQVNGLHRHTINQLIAPIYQTALFCGMKTIPPLVLHGSHEISQTEILKFKNLFFSLINDFINNTFNYEQSIKYDYINHYISEKG